MAKFFMSYQKFCRAFLAQKRLIFWILVAELVTKWQRGLRGVSCAAHVSTLRCFYGYAVSSFYGYAVSEFLVLTHVSKFVGLTVSQHCSLAPIFKAFKDLKACGGNSILSSC